MNALPTTSILTVCSNDFDLRRAGDTHRDGCRSDAARAERSHWSCATFYNGAAVIGTGTLVGGVASVIDSSLAGGSYNLTCIYGGSSIYAASNCNSVPVIVNAAPTTLTISSSNNPATYLTPVTFTVHLTANGQSVGAGNAIQLSINGQIVNLSTDATGSATYTIATLVPNSYPVVASFAGTNNLQASFSVANQRGYHCRSKLYDCDCRTQSRRFEPAGDIDSDSRRAVQLLPDQQRAGWQRQRDLLRRRYAAWHVSALGRRHGKHHHKLCSLRSA